MKTMSRTLIKGWVIFSMTSLDAFLLVIPSSWLTDRWSSANEIVSFRASLWSS